MIIDKEIFAHFYYSVIVAGRHKSPNSYIAKKRRYAVSQRLVKSIFVGHLFFFSEKDVSYFMKYDKTFYAGGNFFVKEDILI
jgi:hypothetical protein